MANSEINVNTIGKMQYNIMVFVAICMSLFTLDVITQSIGVLTYRLLLHLIPALGIAMCLSTCRNIMDWKGWLYFINMCLGYMAHRHMTIVFETPLVEFLLWAVIPFLLYTLNNGANKTNILLTFVLLAYCTICAVCIYERLSHSYLFTFANEYQATAGIASDYSSLDFRARGLFGHPLYNANVVSMMLALFLSKKDIRPSMRNVLLILGLSAIWACNSRGCLLVWLLILAYRLFLYDKKLWITIPSIMLAYFLLPHVIQFISDTGILGRLDFTFDDDSSKTRFAAFAIFASHNWTLQEILLGGDVLYYGYTNVALENGILLNLSYWGWIIGGIKTVLEIILTWSFLGQYKKIDRFIIMLAFWGVAFINNNSFQNKLLLWFIVANAAISYDSSNYGSKIKQLVYGGDGF